MQVDHLLNYLIHIDVYLNSWVALYGNWIYWILFTVIFCETGLVVTPFLPGDSLLFAAGSIAAQSNSSFNYFFVFALLLTASILGNQINYMIGKAVAPYVDSDRCKKIINQNYLAETQNFYQKHGGLTLIFARFLPIVRTFAPFVAGIAHMKTSVFTIYNVLSAFLWIGSLLSFGYFLGNIPLVKENFSLVIYTIIGFTLAIPLMTVIKSKYFSIEKKQSIN